MGNITPKTMIPLYAVASLFLVCLTVVWQGGRLLEANEARWRESELRDAHFAEQLDELASTVRSIGDDRYRRADADREREHDRSNRHTWIALLRSLNPELTIPDFPE